MHYHRSFHMSMEKLNHNITTRVHSDWLIHRLLFVFVAGVCAFASICQYYVMKQMEKSHSEHY